MAGAVTTERICAWLSEDTKWRDTSDATNDNFVAFQFTVYIVWRHTGLPLDWTRREFLVQVVRMHVILTTVLRTFNITLTCIPTTIYIDIIMAEYVKVRYQYSSQFKYIVCRDSSASIATRYWLDGPGIEFRWGGEGGKILPNRPARLWAPPSLLHDGHRSLSRG